MPRSRLLLRCSSGLAVFLMFFASAGFLIAWERPVNEEAMTQAATAIVEGVVEESKDPSDWSGFTRVSIRVEKVIKGDIRPDSLFIVYHEPSSLEPKKGGLSSYSRFQCPPRPNFIKGARYKVWAEWDPSMTAYYVPFGQWTKRIVPEEAP